ncbi:pilus assembly protein N-terminal domain-containing protein [Aliidiomarina indica]|uniref:pilus assembly protein N-terminal domain-containing protein n=1 Tax=Aliidiomarina indica TaxID=2749147 RepID=UPI00188FD1EF|nr:pilus assembly protein N-terminal domain-containing protein [Aliidiomarina indica]
MFKRLLASMYYVVCINGLIAILPAQATELDTTIWLELGQIHIEALAHEPLRIAIADPEVVDVQLNDANEFVFLPTDLGQSDVFWWLPTEHIVKRRVQVLPAGSKGLVDFLRAEGAPENQLQMVWQQGALVLEGRVTEQQFQALQGLQNRYTYLDLSALTVTAAAIEMLELEVYVVELSQRFLRNTGIAWDGSMQGPRFRILSDLFGHAELGPLHNEFPATSARQRGYLGWAGSLESTLQLLQERGEGRVLAKPRLRVESGAAADFLVGGELPIPQVNAQGLTDVTFKPYGIRLQIAPTLLSSGWIRTEIASEVSQPDSSVAVQGIPGLRSRRASTQVTSAHNDTAVIAGLISRDEFSGGRGLPVPNSAAARSGLTGERSTQQLDTELVVFVTARRLAAYEAEQAEMRDAWQELRRRFTTVGCNGMVFSSEQGAL